MSGVSSCSEMLANVLPKISVFGVGGAGINAVNNMILSQLDGIKFIVANTDCQSLMNSLAETKIQLGIKCTKGLGAGSNPEVGKQSAEEACDIIKRELADVDMLFIATGMGGGTGTGASPVIAKIAKDMGVLTIAIAIKPFVLEGKKRMETAKRGIAELEKIVDTLIVIENQKLMELNNASMFDNYAIADSILRQSVYCVVSILSKQGFINRDFADVKTVLSCAGRAVIGYGEDIDPKVATDLAIHNQVLENNSIHGAKNILVNICGSRNVKPADIEEIVNKIRDEAKCNNHEEPNVIFGIVLDEDLGNKIRVSVIASGVVSNINSKVSTDDFSIKTNSNNIYSDVKMMNIENNTDATIVKNENIKELTEKKVVKVQDDAQINNEDCFNNEKEINNSLSHQEDVFLKKEENSKIYEATDSKITNVENKDVEDTNITKINTIKQSETFNTIKQSETFKFDDVNKNNDSANKDKVINAEKKPEHEKIEAPVFAKPIDEDDLENDESFNLKIEDIIRNNNNLNENLIPFQENYRSYEKKVDNSFHDRSCKQNFHQKQDSKNLQFGLFNETEPRKTKSFLSKFIDSIGGSIPEIDTNDVNVYEEGSSKNIDLQEDDASDEMDLNFRRKIG